ncbi:MAG TPA: F0F1 ATP synthase subunit gamma [Steroidobacteraceae bacterium]|nr:F0F1 ATP synthase subunit gamma [Steroidobacteraceae bacterium]
MPGTKEIRVKIASVKSTQKITKAMQMVATSKMRRAQERMRLARPYAAKIRSVIGNLTQANPDYRHPFLQERQEVKNVGVIVISSDRGLCGSLNINIFKQALTAIRDWQAKGASISMCVVGGKATAFFRRLPNPVLSQIQGIGDFPRVSQLVGTIKVMLDAYREGKLDRLLLVHTTFVNTMTQKPEVVQLLPVEPVEDAGLQEHWDYIYEPEASDILDAVLRRYIEALVYRGLVENVASEMAARMVAMKAATDNAGKLIGELQLVYNKARQAAITKELAEIVGGAAAV